MYNLSFLFNIWFWHILSVPIFSMILFQLAFFVLLGSKPVSFFISVFLKQTKNNNMKVSFI